MQLIYIYLYIYIILKGKMKTVAVQSQYDELLCDKIYLRINKSKIIVLFSLLWEYFI